jgi:hypothetical protein
MIPTFGFTRGVLAGRRQVLAQVAARWRQGACATGQGRGCGAAGRCGVKFAYADPPYLGEGKRLYGHLHPDAADYDDPAEHQRLIERLSDEYPDGWAMSLHVPSLRTILPMCPDDVRVAAWCKTWHQIYVNVPVQWAWEPVIWRGGRTVKGRNPMVRDWLASSRPIGQKVPGQKPDAFSFWVFDLLGAEVEDTFDDLFPGSGAVGASWNTWRANRPLPFLADAPETPLLLEESA